MNKEILNTPHNLSLLSRLGMPEVQQPETSYLIEALYTNMFGVIMDNELEQEAVETKTRIYALDEEHGVWKGNVFKRNQKAVVADVIRAGIQPSNLFYMKLTNILDPKNVRQDHIMAQRVEGEDGSVASVSLMASKIDGSIEDAIVFIPDPMGATGGSITEVIEYYQEKYGKPKKFVVVNLVVTETYLKRLEKIDAPISVYTARLDDGLTKTDYIYPGLGGVGEMINNTNH